MDYVFDLWIASDEQQASDLYKSEEAAQEGAIERGAAEPLDWNRGPDGVLYAEDADGDLWSIRTVEVK